MGMKVSGTFPQIQIPSPILLLMHTMQPEMQLGFQMLDKSGKQLLLPAQSLRMSHTAHF